MGVAVFGFHCPELPEGRCFANWLSTLMLITHLCLRKLAQCYEKARAVPGRQSHTILIISRCSVSKWSLVRKLFGQSGVTELSQCIAWELACSFPNLVGNPVAPVAPVQGRKPVLIEQQPLSNPSHVETLSLAICSRLHGQSRRAFDRYIRLRRPPP